MVADTGHEAVQVARLLLEAGADVVTGISLAIVLNYHGPLFSYAFP